MLTIQPKSHNPLEDNQPKRSWLNVNIMALAHFMSDYYTAFLAVLLPIIAVRYEISYSQSAAVYMIFSIAMNFIQPPIGIVADKRNLNYIMPLSVLSGGIFASIILLSPNLTTLMCIVLLCGICSSGFHPVSASILTRVLPLKSKGFGTSIYIAGGNLGFALAPIIVASFIEYFGEDSLVWMALPAIVTTLLIYKQKLHTKAQNVTPSPSLKELLEQMRSKQFIFLNTAMAFRSWTHCSFVVFTALLFSANGFSSIEGASGLVVFLIGAVAGGLAGGALTDKFGPKRVTIASFILALITGIIFLQYCDLSLLSLTALFLCGAGLYGSTPNAIVWGQRLMPNNAAFAASMMLGFTFGAGYIASVITGYFGDLFTLRQALLWTVVLTMLIAIILLALLKEPPKDDSNELIEQTKQDYQKHISTIKIEEKEVL